RLIDDVEVGVLQAAIAPAVHLPDPHLVPDERPACGKDVVHQLEVALALHIGERFPHRMAEHLAMATNHCLEAGIRHAEDVLGPFAHGDHRRSLPEYFLQPLTLPNDFWMSPAASRSARARPRNQR